METSVASTWAPSDVYHCGLDNCFGGVKPGTQHYEVCGNDCSDSVGRLAAPLTLLILARSCLRNLGGAGMSILLQSCQSEFQKPWEERQLYSE